MYNFLNVTEIIKKQLLDEALGGEKNMLAVCRQIVVHLLVVQKPFNADPVLKVNRMIIYFFYYYKCFSLIFVL